MRRTPPASSLRSMFLLVGLVLVFLLVGLVLVLLLPSPWNAAALLGCIALFVGELAFWNRRVRGHRN